MLARNSFDGCIFNTLLDQILNWKKRLANVRVLVEEDGKVLEL